MMSMKSPSQNNKSGSGKFMFLSFMAGFHQDLNRKTRNSDEYHLLKCLL
jgi:hypothetical protein